MSRVPLSRRLSLLLGADIGTIKREHLEQLVGLREDDDLEVKSQLYGNSDRERRGWLPMLQPSRTAAVAFC